MGINTKEKKFKILHIVSGKLDGGAARGAFWLHKALQNLGVTSTILTNSTNNLNDHSIIEITENSIYRNNLEKQILSQYPNKIDFIFSTGFLGFDFTKLKIYKEADIVHLHWINNNFVDMRNLKDINKPIVWTLRDMWPMTGGCHYSFDCKKYISECKKCPQLKSTSQNDLSSLVFKYKKYNLPKYTQIVGISSWLSNEAKKSKLLKKFDIKTISNNIDTELFKTYDKNEQKEFFGLPKDKTILLFGANNIEDPYKGFGKLKKVTQLLSKEKYFLCFFGNTDAVNVKKLGLEYKLFGKINNDEKLNKIYAATDIFLALSTQEAFGKTLVESMSSGTPVVCFNATGPKDIIEHKIDGYKAKPFSSKDVYRGIEWIENNYEFIRSNAIKNSRKKFDSIVIAKKYKKLYEDMLIGFTNNKLKSNKRKSNINTKVDSLKNNYISQNRKILENNIRIFYTQVTYLTNSNNEFIIYGNGTISKTIQALIPEKIVGYVDMADKNNHPKNLKNMEYDKIIISVLGREEEIIKYLVEDLKIARDKIITLEL